MVTIQEKLKKHNNDYSCFEPFMDDTPLSSSVIIPAFEEPHLLDSTLVYLNRARKGLEDFIKYIVVDDGSKDKSVYNVAKNHLFSKEDKVIRHKKNLGRVMARNTGIQEANEDIIFFFDSDFLAPKGYFQEHWKIHNHHKRSIAVGLAENIQPKELKSLPEILQPSNYQKDFRYYKDISKWGEGIHEVYNTTNAFKNFNYGRKVGTWTLPYMVVTHNISLRREQAENVKGFDERFTGWGCEDTYFGAKLIAKGNQIIPVTKNTGYRVKHPVRTGSEEQRKKEMMDNMKLYDFLIQ